MATTAKKKTTAKKGIEVNMTVDRDTKNTRRFQADEEDAPIDTLYVKKSGFKGTMPDTITVTVS